jgi:hypothetical protein
MFPRGETGDIPFGDIPFWWHSVQWLVHIIRRIVIGGRRPIPRLLDKVNY